KRDWSGEQAQHDQRAAHKLHHARHPGQRRQSDRVVNRDMREMQKLARAMLEKQQPRHDPEKAKQPRAPDRKKALAHIRHGLPQSWYDFLTRYLDWTARCRKNADI